MFHQKTRGQALAEFALVLMIIMMIVFLLVEGARMFLAYQEVQDAARTAGRYAVTGQADTSCLAENPACDDPRVTSIKRVAEEKLASAMPIDPDALPGEPRYYQVEIWGENRNGDWVPDFAGEPGRAVRIRVTYRIGVLTPVFQPIAESVQLFGEVVENNEQFLQEVGSNQDDGGGPPGPPPPPPPPDSLDLQLFKEAPDTVIAGETIEYRLLVTNNSLSTSATDVEVVDTYPAELTVGSFSTGCQAVAGTVQCNLPTLPPGVSAEFIITMDIPPGVEDVTVTNFAEVSANEPESKTENNFSQATTYIAPLPTEADLSVIKFARPSPAFLGNELEYSLTVQNLGLDTAEAVTLVDTLPGTVTFNSVSPAGSCSESAGVVTCNLGDIPWQGAVTVYIYVTPNQVGSIVNTATVSSNTTDPNPANNTAQVTTNVISTADLAIEKTDFPDPVPFNGTITYDIDVTNNGPLDATRVTMVDVLPINVTFQSVSTTQGSCTQVARVVACELGTVPNGGAAQMTIQVVANEVGTITNQASVYSPDQVDNIPFNNVDLETTTITGLADMAITKVANPELVEQGESIAFNLTVTNLGPTPATGVMVQDQLPAAVSFLSATPSRGSCSLSGTLVTCLLGNMAVDEVANVTINVVAVAVGDGANTATVSANEPDPDLTNNSSTATFQIEDGPPFLVLNPVCGDAGLTGVSVSGYNFQKNKQVNIYWDPAGTNQTLATGVSTGPVGNWTTQVNIPAGVPFGTYTILAEQTTGNTEAETEFSVPCPAPDLVISSGPTLVSTEPITANVPVVFSLEVSNIGIMDAVSQFFVGVYFDPDPPPAPGDTSIPPAYLVEVEGVNPLAVGQSVQLLVTVNGGFPTPGDHSVYAFVDKDGIISEMDETNNISDELVVTVVPANATPTPTPAVTLTPTPADPGSIIGQTFIPSGGGNPLPQANVRVKLYNEGTGALISDVFSDSAGFFFHTNLSPGSYTMTGCIVIEGTEYFAIITGITLSPGQNLQQDLFLEEGICTG